MPSVNVENITVTIDRLPDTCPYCHHAIEPTFYVGAASGNHSTRDTHIELALKCTRHLCRRLFISIYKRTAFTGKEMIGPFKWQRSVPIEPKPPHIPPEIATVSNLFGKIFTQAATADAMGLDTVAGVGYRKALEFLIKDFSVKKNPSKSAEIQNKLLGKVIDEFVDDPNIKVCAKRAAWLGNDETHYLRKWEDKDIEDLKVLIQLTVNWVVNHVLTEKYLLEMSPTP